MKQKTLSLFLILLLAGFPQISETIYTPSLPDVATSLNVKPYLAELTVGIYFIGFMFGVFCFGILSDRIGRRKSILYGICIYILGCLGCQYSSSIEMMLFFRIVQAFGASTGSVVTQTMIRDVYEGNERVKIFCFVGASLALSPALGPVIGGYVSQFLGWTWNFALLFMMGVFILLYCIKNLPETIPSKISSISISKLCFRMCKDMRILAFACLIALCNGIMFSYYGEAPFIFIELLGCTPGQYGLMGVVIAGASLIASLTSNRLAKKMVPEVSMMIGAIVTFCGSLLLSLIALFGWVDIAYGAYSIFFVLSSMMVIVFGLWLLIPNALSIALKDYKDVVGSAGSIFGAMYYLLIAVLTLFMSYLHNATALPMPLYFTALSSILVVLSYIYVPKSTFIPAYGEKAM